MPGFSFIFLATSGEMFFKAAGHLLWPLSFPVFTNLCKSIDLLVILRTNKLANNAEIASEK